MDIDPLFHRHEIAARLTSTLLGDDPLHQSGRSGLFLAAPRRTGKTTFLLHDLIPTIEAAGAIAVYVDLWSDRKRDPADLIGEAVRAKLTAVASTLNKAGTFASRVKKAGAKAKVAGFEAEFGIEIDTVAKSGGTTLARAFEALYKATEKQTVLIIDEAQHALATPAGADTLFALKAARDALNVASARPRLAILATGSVRSKISDLVLRKSQAFYGAAVADFPMLERDYVEHFLRVTLSHRMREDQLPDPGVVFAAFHQLGRRPEELLAVVADAITSPGSEELGRAIVASAHRRRHALLDETSQLFAQLTELQRAIVRRYSKLASPSAFDKDALSFYRTATGNASVSVSNVQKALESLIRQGLFWRSSVGEYALDDEMLAQLMDAEKGRQVRPPEAVEARGSRPLPPTRENPGAAEARIKGPRK